MSKHPQKRLVQLIKFARNPTAAQLTLRLQSTLLRVGLLGRPAGRCAKAQYALAAQLLANAPTPQHQHQKHAQTVQRVHHVRDQPERDAAAVAVVEGQQLEDPRDAGQNDQFEVQAKSDGAMQNMRSVNTIRFDTTLSHQLLVRQGAFLVRTDILAGRMNAPRRPEEQHHVHGQNDGHRNVQVQTGGPFLQEARQRRNVALAIVEQHAQQDQRHRPAVQMVEQVPVTLLDLPLEHAVIENLESIVVRTWLMHCERDSKLKSALTC